MAQDYIIVSHVGTLFIGGGVMLAGRLIYNGIMNKRNSNNKYLNREAHDRECDWKLTPIEDNLKKIEVSQTRIFDKIDDIYKIMPKRNGDT